MAIDNRIVASNIAKLRNHRGMTQFQLAAALNVSHQAVSKWETAQAVPDIQTLLQLTQLFGVTMEELLSTEIVIREEAEEDNQEEATQHGFFPGFLNDLIPEEAKQALKNAAGEAKKTFIEVSQDLSQRAEKSFEKAADFAEKAKSDIESRFQKADEAKEPPAQSKPEPDAPKATKANISFEQLSRMAPFMSREKLSDLVLRSQEALTVESIVQIAPFLSRLTIQKLIEKCPDLKADNQVIRRLAPFMGADALYQLILNNLEDFDWKTLEGLAPFLKRNMVDALAEYAITGEKPQAPSPASEEKSAKDTLQDSLGNVMGEIGNVVNEIGNVVKNIFTPKQEEPETEEPEAEEPEAEEPEAEEPGCACAPDIMEEMEKRIPTMEEIEKYIPTAKQSASDPAAGSTGESADKIARYALESGNWAWLRDQAGTITDPGLLSEIALSAVSAIAHADSAPIIMKIAHRLPDEGKKQLFKKIADENAWELAVALQTYASEENAAIIILAASEAKGVHREEAYLAIEYYAKIAPKEIIEQITDKAVSEDNWVLLNALTDAF